MTSLTPAQTEELREAIRRAVATVPGAFVGPLMNPLIAELKPVIESLLASTVPVADTTPRPADPMDAALADLGLPKEFVDEMVDEQAKIGAQVANAAGQSPSPAGPGLSLLVAFWSEDEDGIVVRTVGSLDDPHPEDEDGARLKDADVLIAFGSVGPERLKQLTHWAHMTLEEDVVAYAGGPHLSPLALNGIEEVLDVQAARTGDPRQDFAPPAELIPTSVVVPDAQASEIAAVAAQLGMPSDLIDMMLAAEATDDSSRSEAGPVTASFWSVTEQRYVVREVEGLDVEFDEYQHGDQTLSDANTVLAFGDVTPARLLQLTQWAFESFGSDLDVIGFAGPASMAAAAVDGIPHVLATHAEVVAEPIAGLAPPDEEYNPYPERSAYTPIAGGPGTTAPFAVILTDPGDWPYNNAFVSDDAALLHRIEHDRSMPRDEVLAEVSEHMQGVGENAESEGKWWASVNKALDDAGIPEDRRHEGIYY